MLIIKMALVIKHYVQFAFLFVHTVPYQYSKHAEKERSCKVLYHNLHFLVTNKDCASAGCFTLIVFLAVSAL